MRPFSLVVEASFMLSTMKNWRSGKISFKYLMIQSYERTIKSFTVAFFSPLQVNFDLLEMADHGNSCSGAWEISACRKPILC